MRPLNNSLFYIPFNLSISLYDFKLFFEFININKKYKVILLNINIIF